MAPQVPFKGEGEKFVREVMGVIYFPHLSSPEKLKEFASQFRGMSEEVRNKIEAHFQTAMVNTVEFVEGRQRGGNTGPAGTKFFMDNIGFTPDHTGILKFIGKVQKEVRDSRARAREQQPAAQSETQETNDGDIQQLDEALAVDGNSETDQPTVQSDTQETNDGETQQLDEPLAVDGNSETDQPVQSRKRTRDGKEDSEEQPEHSRPQKKAELSKS
ncbi:hypothetical protein BJ508DRAFT_316062 [Ascobolus immersus RN42]|uniref:Uncharacterized protein n=1 Tax=Ascobolus immersus RN42 TaxID=1160509 RepID=A0A3N4H7Y2_ASCIM|nr:hypothetical protein BJ508DRAFT_316062 [Ascobolus immersus RN42]